MENDNRMLLVEEAMKDENFARNLADAESNEEAQKIFAEKGIEFSLDEIKAIAAGIQQKEGELGEGDLEAVSGGVVLGPVLGIPVIIGAGLAVYNTIKRIRW